MLWMLIDYAASDAFAACLKREQMLVYAERIGNIRYSEMESIVGCRKSSIWRRMCRRQFRLMSGARMH